MTNPLNLKKPVLLGAGLLIPALIAAQALAQGAPQPATDRLTSVVELRVAQATGAGGPVTVQAAPRASGRATTVTAAQALQASAANDKRVSVDLNQATVRNAIRILLGGSGDNYSIDADVPDDPRITLKAHDVRLSTALDLLADTAGVGWALDIRDGKRNYRFAKSLAGMRSIRVFGVPAAPGAFGGNVPIPDISKHIQSLEPLHTATIYRSLVTEQRSSFTCPHCKGHVMVLKASKKQAACPKCNRTIQGDWQFCPYDGTKRPAATQEEWRYCPFCGKKVEMEKAMMDESAPGIPVLKDLPYVGNLFTLPNTDIDVEVAPLPAPPRTVKPQKAPRPVEPAPFLAPAAYG